MLAHDLQLLVDAAEASGKIARKHFQANPEIWDKGDGQGPVTEADLAIDRMLHSELLGARPDHGWLSEETDDNTDRLTHSRVFIIDPIDGTRAFIAGLDHFSHSLAIAEDGKIVAAVVHLPMKNMTYTATKGGGAFLNGQPITPSTQTVMDDAEILVNGSMMKPEYWQKSVPNFKRNFRPSLAYRVCLAAEGRFDAMLTLRPTWEWDVAAGDLIAQEAGAVVTTAQNQTPIYNNPKPQLAGMITAGAEIHRQLMDHL